MIILLDLAEQDWQAQHWKAEAAVVMPGADRQETASSDHVMKARKSGRDTKPPSLWAVLLGQEYVDDGPEGVMLWLCAVLWMS